MPRHAPTPVLPVPPQVRRAAALAALAALTLASCSDPAQETAPIAASWEEAFDASGGWLLNVGGPTADQLYAVGGHPRGGDVQEFDGQTWAPGGPPFGTPLLNWVHGCAADDVVVVGTRGAILRFDGASWTRDESPTDKDLWGVWGASCDDLWVVGGNGREEGQATILRYDGTVWTEVETPPLERPQVWAWFKVWGSGPDDVFIVGQRGAVLHWNGSELTEEFAGASDDLIAVWGTGPDHVVAVGGRGIGIVSVWDGSEWTTTDLAPTPGLNGVWLDGPVAHVAGVLGTVGTFDTRTGELTLADVDTQLDFHAIHAAPGGPLIAVGGNFRSADGPYEGIALQAQRTSEP